MTARRGWFFSALVGACMAGVSGGTCLAATRYVYTNSPSPGDGYTSWATAAHSIQEAIDAATAGDTVLVTNGVYATGGRVVSINGPAGLRSGPTNRVVVDKAIMVTSVNGPESTHIVGQGPPGSNAVRCVYLAGGARVSGFTLRDGASKSFQGLSLGESPNGIVDSGGGVYCANATAVVSNCVVTGCLAAKGGGGYQGTWVACEITRNLAGSSGGGVANATLNRCVVTDNTAHTDVVGNQANGGGISGGSACNTSIADNHADAYGGGSYESRLTNVTVVFNTGKYNGGSYDYSVVNSIIYYNSVTASDYDAQRNWRPNYKPSYTCTTPAPAGGTMNVTNPPTLCSTRNPRLFASSPGIDAGNNAAASGATDLPGGPRILGSAVDMGCVEHSNGPHTGLLTVAIEPPDISTTAGTELTLEARISGDPVASCWEWAGQAVSNAFLVQVSFAASGDHPVALRVTNATMSAIATAWVHVAQSDFFAYYASPTGTHLYPFTSLATAATNLQDAINAAAFDGATVWVDKGLYDNSVTNIDGLGRSRIALMRPIVVRSLHGPAETVICGSTGEPPVRCAYVGAGAQLIGLTLTGGSASTNYSNDYVGHGGGAFFQGGVISGCVVRANRAYNGGGVYGEDSFIYDSIIESNCATYNAGGAAAGVVDRCRVAYNRAGNGGGGCGSAINSLILKNYSGTGVGGVGSAVNCTIVGNRSGGIGGGTSGVSGHYGLTSAMNCINYDNDALWSGPNTYDHWEPDEESPVACVTWPAGDANTSTNQPLIVSLDNPNLLPGSPAIDGGLNAHTNSYQGVTRAPETVDLDGKARIENGRVDIGCIEFDASSLTGRLSVAILPMATQCATRASVSFETSIWGRPTGYTWDFGDGATLPNLYRAWHAFAAPGRYDVVLTVSNLTDRASATVTVEVVETAYYVSPDGTHTPPFTNWATAAHDIQSAIDAATVIGATVWVAPGDYATGGRAMNDLSIYDSQNANRVAVFKPLTIRSSGGPAVTRIVGSGTNGPERTRGVYLTDYSSLIGFTVTNGCANNTGGGGIFCEPRAIVSNCVIVGNVGATVGGRIYDSRIARNIESQMDFVGSRLIMGGWFVRCLIEENVGIIKYSRFWNCVIRNNRNVHASAILEDCRCYGCTIVGNRRPLGPGSLNGVAYEGAYHNCIFHDNLPLNLMSSYPLSYTFMDLWSPANPGCIIQPDPKFVDYAAGDYRLRADSPCIDAGTNSRAWWAQIPEGSALVNPIDGNLDGYARCDMGAFEYSPVPAMPSGLTATAAATNRIELAWADNASNESGYLVARSPDSNDWVLVTLTGANATNYSDSGLATNTLYYYRVAASNAAGLSAYCVVTGRTWTVYEQWRQTQFDAVSLTNAAVSSDTADPDHDGLNNQQEFWAGTNPTNASSCLVLYALTNNPALPGEYVVQWQSATGRLYTVQAATNLVVVGFTNLATHLPATPPVNVHTDNVSGVGCRFYRVQVE